MRYLKLGLILIVVIILFECGKDKPSAPSIPDPVASFTESGGTVAPALIIFQNTSQNADTYLWRFGDGDSTTLTSPEHTFNTYGAYSVTLVALNSNTGKSSNKIKLITITPSTVSIASIRFDDIPFTDQYGAGWDLASGPDVYPDFVDASSIIFTLQPYPYWDVTPSSLPLLWSLSQPFQIPEWATAYFIEVWDYDGFGDDFMGSTNGFRINDVIVNAGYASTVSLHNNSNTIRVVISLSWQ